MIDISGVCRGRENRKKHSGGPSLNEWLSPFLHALMSWDDFIDLVLMLSHSIGNALKRITKMVTSVWQKVGREREENGHQNTDGQWVVFLHSNPGQTRRRTINYTVQGDYRAGFQGSQHTEMIPLTEPETVIILIKSLHTAHMYSITPLSTNK